MVNLCFDSYSFSFLLNFIFLCRFKSWTERIDCETNFLIYLVKLFMFDLVNIFQMFEGICYLCCRLSTTTLNEVFFFFAKRQNQDLLRGGNNYDYECNKFDLNFLKIFYYLLIFDSKHFYNQVALYLINICFLL